MRSLLISTAVLTLLAGFLTGCHAPAQPTEPTVARVSAPTPEDYDRLWDSVSDTLRRRYWTLDRQDRIEGVITTHPETSANFFEVWRPQPKPAYYYAESNLATVERKATVSITPVDQTGSYDLSVQVDRLRYSLEERQIDNSAAALRIFNRETPTVGEGRKERLSESSGWVPLGRDQFMEQSVLAAILKRYGQGPSSETDTVCPTPATQPE